MRDTFICPGQSLEINLDTLTGRYRRDTLSYPVIEPLDGKIHRPFSPLVLNLPVTQPVTKLDGVVNRLARICLDIRTPDASDLEVMLLPPSGDVNRIIELINPGTAAQSPDLVQTCFTPEATIPLSGGISPYAGDFAIAGNWSGVTGENSNGIWKLWVSDRKEEPGLPGLVERVILIFETRLSYTVRWATRPGISCLDCRNQVFQPSISTSYPVALTNAAGCIYLDTLTVEVRDKTFGPVFRCQPTGPGQLEVGWNLPVPLQNQNYNATATLRGNSPQLLSGIGNRIHSFSGLVARDSILVRFALPKIPALMCQAIDTTYYCVFPPCSLALTEKENRSVSCYDGSDGILELALLGGYAPTNLQRDGITVPLRSENLKAGTYLFQARDLLGCQTPYSAIIKQPDPIKAGLRVARTIDCYDLAGGIIEAVPSGGNGNYTYLWSPQGGSSARTIPLKRGMYRVVIRDNKGCSVVDSLKLEAPPPLQVMVQAKPTLCFGSSTGGLTTTVTGGSGALQYLWRHGETTANPANLPAGNYQVTVTDAKGCTAEAAEDITQGPMALQVDSTRLTPVSCNGRSDGSARIFLKGGTPPYRITWNDPLSQTGALVNRLAGGTYRAVIVDQNGCTLMHEVTLRNPDPLRIDLVTRNLSCLDRRDGEAEVISSGGTAPYQVAWSDGQLGPRITKMQAGIFALTLTDYNGCTLRDSAVIRNPDNPLRITAVQTYRGCYGKRENTVEARVSGGNPAYFVRWSHGFNGILTSSLDTITYRIVVNDAQGCLDSVAIKPEDLPEMKPEISIREPACHNDQNGELSLVRIGGREGISFDLFRYQWSSGQRTFRVTGLLGAETYALTVTDAKGCSGRAEGYMRNPEQLTLVLSGRNPICHEGTDGRVWLQSYKSEQKISSYSWSAGPVGFGEDTVSQLGAGTYQLTLTNGNGCTGHAAFTLRNPPPLLIAHTRKGNACFGYREGEAEIQVSGGIPSYQLRWPDGVTTFSRKQLPGGLYDVSVTDQVGCTKKVRIDIFQPEPTIIDFKLDSIRCHNLKDGILQFVVFGGQGPFQYSLDGSIWQTGNRISNLGAGKYTIQFIDANRCRTDTVITITEPQAFAVEIGADTYKVPAGSSLVFQPTRFNGQEPVRYQWITPEVRSLSCLDCPNPVLTAQRSQEIQLIATDRKGCQARDRTKVQVTFDRRVLVPTAFSPNQDLQNDLLLVHGADGTKITDFRIFDRWGNLVYQDGGFYTNERNRGWDGRFRQGDAPPGNYEWVCAVEYTDGFRDFLRGQTQLIR